MLDRESSWLKFYGENIEEAKIPSEKIAQAGAKELQVTEAALAEAQFALSVWDGDYQTARRALEEVVENTARADTALAGWHNLWIGACYAAEGDQESAHLAYRRARQRLGRQIALPTGPGTDRASIDTASAPQFATELDRVVGLESEESFRREIGKIRSSVAYLDTGSYKQNEEAVRSLGEALGFEASRPDNAFETGPDVLWVDHDENGVIGFELKTEKQAPASYTKKKDISQSHDHISYIKENYPDKTFNGLVFVGPKGRCEKNANPSVEMWLVQPHELRRISDDLLALMNDIRSAMPLERPARIKEACQNGEWGLGNLAIVLCHTRMVDLKTTQEEP